MTSVIISADSSASSLGESSEVAPAVITIEEHKYRGCPFYLDLATFNLGNSEGYESDLQCLIEAFSQKKNILYLCHRHTRGKIPFTWSPPDDVKQLCQQISITKNAYFQSVKDLLRNSYYPLALNGHAIEEDIAKSTADLRLHSSLIARLPGNKFDDDELVVFRNVQLRDLYTGNETFEVGMLTILEQMLDPEDANVKLIFTPYPEVYEKSCEVLEKLRQSFDDQTFIKRLELGDRVISCKTKMLNVCIAAIEGLSPQYIADPVVMSVVYMLRLAVKIASLTIAGPIHGFALGFRYGDKNIQGTNGLLLPFNLFATRSINALQQLIQDDSIITNVDGSPIEDDFTRLKYTVLLCGLFIRDTEELTKRTIPAFRVNDSDDTDINFTSATLKSRPPLIYQLTNDQLVPIIAPLAPTEICDLQTYIQDFLMNSEDARDALKDTYANGRDMGPDYVFDWDKVQYYMHSEIVVAEVAPLYKDIKAGKPRADFVTKLNARIAENAAIPGCVGLRRLVDDQFWTLYKARYPADCTNFVLTPRDTVYLNQYLLLKTIPATSKATDEIITELHRVYPESSHFRHLGRGPGKSYSIDSVGKALQAAIEDHGFPSRV